MIYEMLAVLTLLLASFACGYIAGFDKCKSNEKRKQDIEKAKRDLLVVGGYPANFLDKDEDGMYENVKDK